MQDSSPTSNDQMYQQALDEIQQNIDDMEAAELRASQAGKGLGDYDLSAATASVRQERMAAEKLAEQERAYMQQAPEQQMPLAQAGQGTISATPRGPLGFTTDETGEGGVRTGDDPIPTAKGGKVILDPTTGMYLTPPKPEAGRERETKWGPGLTRVSPVKEKKAEVIGPATNRYGKMGVDEFEQKIGELESRYRDIEGIPDVFQDIPQEEQDAHNEAMVKLKEYQDILRPKLLEGSEEMQKWIKAYEAAPPGERRGMLDSMPKVDVDLQGIKDELKKKYPKTYEDEYKKYQRLLRYGEHVMSRAYPGQYDVTGDIEKATAKQVMLGGRSASLLRGEQKGYEDTLQVIRDFDLEQGLGKKGKKRHLAD